MALSRSRPKDGRQDSEKDQTKAWLYTNNLNKALSNLAHDDDMIRVCIRLRVKFLFLAA